MLLSFHFSKEREKGWLGEGKIAEEVPTLLMGDM